MRVVLDGEIPAAIETPSGLVSAPDPRRPVGAPRSQKPSAGGTFDAETAGRYEPDTDTRRPDLLPYDEPFTPSTAPFKRLLAFDGVDSSYRLVVSDPTLRPLDVGGARLPGSPEESFFADIVVRAPTPRAGRAGPLRGSELVRIPSVGPGARVVHARFGAGARDIDSKLWHDGADNWFIEAPEAGRLVMEVSIPRAAFGGLPSGPLPGGARVAAPPPEVVRDANLVAQSISLDRTTLQSSLTGLVGYFRAFTDSIEPPAGHGNVYLDLALSRKGVCRHRAYAFTVTALGLGIPARMVMNEAHAWVEVHDGKLWKRIDLGGAGRMLDAPRDAAVLPYQPPPDPYAWPPDAESGEELGRFGQDPAPVTPGATSPGGAAPGAASRVPTRPPEARPEPEWPTGIASPRDAGSSRITMQTREGDARRGAPLDVRGEVQSAGEPCGRVTVEVALRDARASRVRAIGSLATDDAGKFSGLLIVPFDVPTGDYDLIAHAPASTACAEGFSE